MILKGHKKAVCTTALILLSTAVGCGDDDKKKGADSDGFAASVVGSTQSATGVSIPTIITDAQLEKPEGAADVEFSEVLTFLNASDELYVEKKSSTETPTSDDPCLSDGVSVDGKTGYIMISGKSDYSKCEEPFPVTSTSVIYYGCEGTDFSSIRKPSEFEEQKAAVCESGEEFVQSMVSVSSGDGMGEMSLQTQSQTSNADGAPCEFSIDSSFKRYSESCNITSVEDSTTTNPEGEVTTTTYSKITFPAVMGIPTAGTEDKWLGQGEVTVVYNNWTVTLTYTDVLSPPTYSATNGSETETGSLDAKAAETEL